MQFISKLLHPARWKYQWRYWRRQTPWDTDITPPEVMEFIETVTPGRALDLGCGTGTNAITLANHGWDVIRVDKDVHLPGTGIGEADIRVKLALSVFADSPMTGDRRMRCRTNSP